MKPLRINSAAKEPSGIEARGTWEQSIAETSALKPSCGTPSLSATSCPLLITRRLTRNDTCRNNRVILAFLYPIPALYRRMTVPIRLKDLYTLRRTGGARSDYMKKMYLTDGLPIRMVMPPAAVVEEEAEPAYPPAPAGDQPSPAATDQATPVPSPAVTSEAQASSTTTLESAPEVAEHQPPPAQTSDAPSLHLLQLRNQLQRIEARQLQFIEDTKVFQLSLVQFLIQQFPAVASFFPNNQAGTPQANQSSVEPSITARKTETVHYSSNVASDAFDWNTPYKQQLSSPVRPPVAHIPELSNVHKRKAPAVRILNEEHVSPTTTEVEEEEQTSPQPVKRQRRYHVITHDNDTDSSEIFAF
ncbi:hypothetical protein V6N12_029032 [Hibiscus sabdariffa]|uniref:Uncharacterized protein n=1 Tax=Hibiscus sabdariffa TaxID=183260 RepID=A0ABR2F7J8_9ROSI